MLLRNVRVNILKSTHQQDTRLIYRNLLHFFTLIVKYQKRKVKNNPL